MRTATIHQVIEVLSQSFARLDVRVAPLEVEDLAVTVHRIMTVEARQYHSLEHVSRLWVLDDPLHSLAAPFHDLVYYQIDGGIPAPVCALIAPYLHENEGQVSLVEAVDPTERAFLLTLALFGFQPGQKLAFSAGLNEFLSALFMNVRLQRLVGEADRLRMVACIEATIPFRAQDSLELLAGRLRQANERYGVGMTGEEIEAAVRSAAVFGNCDVAGFAAADPASFLEDTWKLLPEGNAVLRLGEVYSIREYRRALEGTARFMASLKAEVVFHRYGGVPEEAEFARLVGQAGKNIAIAGEYLGSKSLAMAVLEALAESSGGDAPVSLFMGPIERLGEHQPRMEDFMPPVEAPRPDLDPAIVHLLDYGRGGLTSFDLQNSPLALFLYQNLGPETAHQVLEQARSMFAGRIGPREFLAGIDGPVVATIARACAAMVPTRREVLGRYAEERDSSARL